MLAQYQKKLTSLQMEYDHAQKSVVREEKALKEAKEEEEAILQGQQLVQSVAKAIQTTAHQRIASVVSRCLAEVFEEPYEFQIIFEEKRGKTEARLVFIRDGNEVDPVYASGGGVLDVASFALRLASLVLAQPRQRRLLVLDEPFRFLSEDYVPRIREMLKTLSKEMKLQILMVTHSKELEVGTVISF